MIADVPKTMVYRLSRIANARYERRGVPEKEAERRAWATVNKDDGGGKKSGSGRGVETGQPAAHRTAVLVDRADVLPECGQVERVSGDHDHVGALAWG